MTVVQCTVTEVIQISSMKAKTWGVVKRLFQLFLPITYHNMEVLFEELISKPVTVTVLK